MAKILLVEDERAIRTFVKANLQVRGYEVAEAETAEAGLDLLPTFQPDLIILDIMLPGIDGWEMARIMAENPEWKTIPIMVMSATVANASVAVETLANVTCRLTKPISSGDLIAAVKQCVK